MIKVIVKSAGETHELTLTETVMFIGRAGDCQIKLTDLKTSRKHARIERVGDAYKVFDCESGNGTRVNGSLANDFALAKGDEISLGETTIAIADLDTPAPHRVAPTVEVFEKEPVPVDKKLDVKQRIDEVRKAIDEAKSRDAEPVRTKILRKLAGVAAACVAVVIIGVVVAAVVDSMQTQTPTAGNGKAKLSPTLIVKEADGAFASFRDKVDSAEKVTDELVAEARELSDKYGDAYRAAYGDQVAVPFDQILQTMMTRRAEGFVAVFARAEAAAREDVKARRYSQALSRLQEFMKAADASFDERVKELVGQIETEIEQDYAAVKTKGELLDSAKRYDEEASHYRIHSARFEGTKYFSLMPRPSDILELAKIESSKAAAIARVEEQKRVAEQKTAPETVKAPEATGLAAMIIKPINAGKLVGRNFPFADKKMGTPLGADAEKVFIKVGDKQEEIAWKDVAPLAMFQMANVLLRDDELLGVAAYGYANGLPGESDKLLVRYIGDKKERQAAADGVIAKARGLNGAPAGGYTWDKTHSWEDKPTRDTRLAREEGDKLAKELANAKDTKKMDAAFAKLNEMVHNTAINAPLRESIKAQTLDALQQNKKARLADIGKKAKASVGMDQVKLAKVELNNRRDAALKVIYDSKIYLPENHADWGKGDKINGQTRVDELVKAVRDLWDKAGSYLASLDPSIKKDIDTVAAINTKYLNELGVETTEDDLKDFEEVMANLDRRIDLKSYAINSKESEIWEWNRKVEKYNENVKEDGITGGIKVHVKVVNDYREMMGRRQCFIDARLCRATTKHSAACNAANRIWHVGSDGDPQSRAKAEGFQGGVGENVAIGYGDGAEIWVRGWYRASDHHRNGLSDAWNCMGYGFVGSVGTQNFSNIAAPKGF